MPRLSTRLMRSSPPRASRGEAVIAGRGPHGIVPSEIEAWFAGRGWRVRRHQTEMLAADDAGQHALLVADTGAGKTLAGFLPTLAAFTPSRLGGAAPPEGLHTLYVSPLKALAHDVQRNLLTPIEEMGLPIRSRRAAAIRRPIARHASAPGRRMCC